jgi:excisionase family DNA binding protein
MKTTELLVGVKQAAEMFGISFPIMYTLCKREGFPAIRIGKRILISVDGLKAWIPNHYGKDVLADVTNEEDTTK